jgi:hypothetical protein
MEFHSKVHSGKSSTSFKSRLTNANWQCIIDTLIKHGEL